LDSHVIAGFDFGKDVVGQRLVALLKCGLGFFDAVTADVVAGTIEERFEVGDAFLRLGEGFVGSCNLRFEFGDVGAEPKFFSFFGAGEFVFEVHFEFAAKADEFDSR
jgi:hypothetical protein